MPETKRENSCNKILLWYFIIIIAMCVFFGGMEKMSFSSKNFFFGVQQRWKLGGNYYSMDRREWESDVFWARECLNHLESHSMLFGGFYWDWFYRGWLHNMRNAHSYPNTYLILKNKWGMAFIGFSIQYKKAQCCE